MYSLTIWVNNPSLKLTELIIYFSLGIWFSHLILLWLMQTWNLSLSEPVWLSFSLWIISSLYYTLPRKSTPLHNALYCVLLRDIPSMNRMLYVIQSEINIWDSFWTLGQSWMHIFLMKLVDAGIVAQFSVEEINFCVQMIICLLPSSSFAPVYVDVLFVAEPVRRPSDKRLTQRRLEVRSCVTIGRDKRMMISTLRESGHDAEPVRWRFGQAGRQKPHTAMKRQLVRGLKDWWCSRYPLSAATDVMVGIW